MSRWSPGGHGKVGGSLSARGTIQRSTDIERRVRMGAVRPWRPPVPLPLLFCLLCERTEGCQAASVVESRMAGVHRKVLWVKRRRGSVGGWRRGEQGGLSPCGVDPFGTLDALAGGSVSMDGMTVLVPLGVVVVSAGAHCTYADLCFRRDASSLARVFPFLLLLMVRCVLVERTGDDRPAACADL